MTAKPKIVKLSGVPAIERVHGLFLQWPLAKERDGADEVLMGVIRLKAVSDDLVWNASLDEIFYCVSGKVRVVFDDAKGSKGEVVANPDEVLFLPRGYHYVMNGAGVETLTVFCKKA